MQNLQENPINRMGLYIVQEGDCVQVIATRFKIPPILLICSNSLKAEPQVGSMLFCQNAMATYILYKSATVLKVYVKNFQ